MSQTCFIRIVQGILGLTWDDAFRFANGVNFEEDRKERICELERLREKIPHLSDAELEKALEIYC